MGRGKELSRVAAWTKELASAIVKGAAEDLVHNHIGSIEFVARSGAGSKELVTKVAEALRLRKRSWSK